MILSIPQYDGKLPRYCTTCEDENWCRFAFNRFLPVRAKICKRNIPDIPQPEEVCPTDEQTTMKRE